MHRQVVFLVWLLAAALSYVGGGLAYSLPVILAFAAFEVLLMRWVAKKGAARR